MKNQTGRIVGLLIVTGFALGAAITATTGGWGRTTPGGNDDSTIFIPRTPVTVMEARRESIEITDRFSGMVRPMERFSLGFEIAGRVVTLGVNTEGEPLDDGDRITAGQMLAKLDDRALLGRVEECDAILEEARAQVTDAAARLEKAQSDLNRSTELKNNRGGIITEAQYQDDVTNLAVAKAQVAIAQASLAKAQSLRPTATKNLEDATLIAPVSGVIAKRLVNVGESVSPHQVVMEIIQVDEVLLVVGVPEAYVGEIRAGQPVHVELLARDRFRRKRPGGEGHVYQVAEAADRTTGLFEVEIKLANDDRQWKPGQIALAHIVLQEVEGYRLPMSSAVVRDGETFLFTVGKDGQPAIAAGEEGKASRFPLGDWIEQDADLILLELPPKHRSIVTRGQHRLVDGREVVLVELDKEDEQGTVDQHR